MALLTIQRSPTPSISGEDEEILQRTEDISDQESAFSHVGSGRSLTKSRSLSECYFAVKGAAVILPQPESIMSAAAHPKTASTSGAEIQHHLEAMLHLLRSHDTLKMAVRLQSRVGKHTRYLAIISTSGRQDNPESAILGIDYVSRERTTLGLILPILADMSISLDGDGGIAVSSIRSHHFFKPVSVQAMWSAFLSLHRELASAVKHPCYHGGLTHTWTQYYEANVNSPEGFRTEWHAVLPEDTDLRVDSLECFKEKSPERLLHEKIIKTTLKDIMQSVDLDEVTSRDIREKLGEKLEMNLIDYKEMIDQEMLVILGQMDKPSQIFPFLYLGTEWNASNYDELAQNNVSYILNVTKEVDNFFPTLFNYVKVHVSDEESTQLLKHWELTYKFINQAKENNKAVLVHCKKGISRSSSTVIAYAMKAYNWPLETALNYVKEKRNCITPNRGFMTQLEVYQGILDASRHRTSALWCNPIISSDAQIPQDGESSTEDDIPLDMDASFSSDSCVGSAAVYTEMSSNSVGVVLPGAVAPSDNIIMKSALLERSSSTTTDPNSSDSSSDQSVTVEKAVGTAILNETVEEETQPIVKLRSTANRRSWAYSKNPPTFPIATTNADCSTTSTITAVAIPSAFTSSLIGSVGTAETVVTVAADENAPQQCEVSTVATYKPRPLSNVIYSTVRRSAIGCESAAKGNQTAAAVHRNEIEPTGLRELRFGRQSDREAKAKQQLWNSLQLARRRILKIPEPEDASVKVFI